ncbi:hypothetical protein [Flavobacterium sp. 316]|uniref:hypothetical protein n=1 Tax=Flavobacterium sp. 316 TaxID=1603293 RepID=UPI000A9D82A7|nr:hypothetical protein [Flavobacterium sp. 316]
MKKKIVIVNFILMLSVLFAVSYQSLHTFSHHSHKEIKSISSEESKGVFAKIISDKESCPVCDFKFASFLSPEIFTYSLFPPVLEIPYLYSNNNNITILNRNSFYLRGPPTLI